MNPPRPVLLLMAMAAVAATSALITSAFAGAQSSPPAATRADLAATLPKAAPGYRLALTRATIPPGGAFAPHRHPGTQVSRVTEGTLRFRVFRGTVHVRRGLADGSARIVRSISAGETGVVRRGEWIVETPAMWHEGSNAGRKRVVILLATLLRKDKPAAIPVQP